MKNLAPIVNERPFQEFAQWWEIGKEFITFMSRAIASQWLELDGTKSNLIQVHSYLTEYLQLVYGQNTDPALIENFIQQKFSRDFYSGEFDALSYAFYRSAFEAIAETNKEDDAALVRERRRFTNRVGKIFFTSIHDYLQLNLPTDLSSPQNYSNLQKTINLITNFLQVQGYLRDQCEFTFSVEVIHAGKRILQDSDDFLYDLHYNGVGYALYIMGYPVILPSAVYLFQMFGEAQHHSSRTIEELFARVGCQARETDDFDPSEFPSEKVVELWSIRQRAGS
jgi:hypothetical protein